MESEQRMERLPRLSACRMVGVDRKVRGVGGSMSGGIRRAFVAIADSIPKRTDGQFLWILVKTAFILHHAPYGFLQTINKLKAHDAIQRVESLAL